MTKQIELLRTRRLLPLLLTQTTGAFNAIGAGVRVPQVQPAYSLIRG